MMLPNKLLMDCSKNKKYDLLFFMIFVGQSFLLNAFSLGIQSYPADELIEFLISFLFYVTFLPSIYWFFYREKKNDFIREMIIFSSVMRLYAFAITGIVAIVQMTIWSLARLERLPNSSLIYYIIYYLIFTFFMENIVRKSKVLTENA